MARKKIAVWMILLVIMLPVYSASVFASLNVEARGQNSVKNYIKEEDVITFKAIASISGDSVITPSQVLLGSNLEFDSCAPSIDGFDCLLRFPPNGTTIFDAKAIPYTITLRNDAGSIVDTKSDNLYVDNLPPKINSFTVDQALVSSGTVKFSFEIEDYACSASSCSEKCSGISKLEIYETNSNFKEIVTLNTDACIVSDSFETSSLIFPEDSHTIYAKAFDRFGQVSPVASLSFKVDKSAPFIDLNTFKVVDDVDIDLGFFGLNPIPVTVKVDINDFDLNKQSVFADLNDLNKQGNLGHVQGTCGETSNDITTCSWDISLNPDGPGQKTITIEASDSTGNDAKSIITKNFGLDSIGPVVLSLASSQVIDGQNFAKLSDNTFTAIFRETGAGVKAQDMKLHGSNDIKTADSCEKALDTWKCTWNGVDFNNAGKVQVFIDTDSKDRLGNLVSERFYKDVIVDVSMPKLLKFVIRTIGGIEGALDIVKTGDKIQVEAALEDDAIESAVADFSRFIVGASNVNADSCIKTGDRTFVCSWTTSSINIEGYINDVIAFEFTDISGNTLTVSEPFTVYGLDGEETPDLFDHSVRCSPSLLDRETFSLINQRAFCQVFLTPKSISGTTFEDVEPISISLGDCTGNIGFVNNFDIFSNNAGSAEIFIRVEFNKQAANVDELVFSCPLDIISRKGTNIITTPEKENVELKFGLYNMPLGEISQEVQKKIDDAIEDSKGIWEFVGFLKTIASFATKACQFINIFENLVATWELFTIGIGITEEAAMTTANPAYAILHPMRVSSCLATEGAHKVVTGTVNSAGETVEGGLFSGFKSFCNMVNCGSTFEDNGKIDFSFGGVETVMAKWQKSGTKLIDQAGGNFIKDWTGKSPNQYLNPKDSIVVAGLTACIPGIIYGLDKYRQIQCMYADCLQTGVGKQGLPVFACEDQKSYAECKYVVGEIFQVFPFTAIFNYYTSMLKNALSNPFTLLGAGLAAGCEFFCEKPSEGLHQACIWTKIVSLLGSTLQEVTSIFEGGVFEIKDDYCDRLKPEKDKRENSGGFFG